MNLNIKIQEMIETIITITEFNKTTLGNSQGLDKVKLSLITQDKVEEILISIL